MSSDGRKISFSDGDVIDALRKTERALVDEIEFKDAKIKRLEIMLFECGVVINFLMGMSKPQTPQDHRNYADALELLNKLFHSTKPKEATP